MTNGRTSRIGTQVSRLASHAIRLLVAIVVPVMAAAAQDPQAANPLEIARRGNPKEAWAVWNRMPNGPDKLRAGVELAVETRELRRGVALYEQLTMNGQGAEPSLLGALAGGAAAELSAAAEPRVRGTACGAALLLDAGHQTCLRTLQAMADSTSAEERTEGIAALANAGIQDYAQRLTQLDLRSPVRLLLVERLTRLAPLDRLAIVRPLLTSSDAALQYQALLALSKIPGGEVVGVLRQLNVSGPVGLAHAVALARHGDAGMLSMIGQQLDNMDTYLKIQAAAALVGSGDRRGGEILQTIVNGPVDLDRIYAAEALARTDPALAERVLIDALVSGSAAVKPAALHVAGKVGLGTAPNVYRRLVGDTGEMRALAVMAVAETVTAHSRTRPPQP
jgi:hypothetical protein